MILPTVLEAAADTLVAALDIIKNPLTWVAVAVDQDISLVQFKVASFKQEPMEVLVVVLLHKLLTLITAVLVAEEDMISLVLLAEYSSLGHTLVDHLNGGPTTQPTRE